MPDYVLVGDRFTLVAEAIDEAAEELEVRLNGAGLDTGENKNAVIPKTFADGRRDLAGAFLYTTAEPCFMCGYAIRQLRIGLVVYGKETPVFGAVTSVHPILTDPALDSWRPAPEVIGGVLREECERLKRKPGA